MPLAKRWIRFVFAASFLAGSLFALAPQSAQKDKVPTFPEYKGQTVGEADAYWKRHLGHPIHFTVEGGKLTEPTTPEHRGLMIVENHPTYPPGNELDPNELIGVVVLPMGNRLWECLWLVLAALASGLLAGWFSARKFRRG